MNISFNAKNLFSSFVLTAGVELLIILAPAFAINDLFADDD